MPSRYKSFARHSDNIGDITAKGEAQIAVIDLIGILSGVLISKSIGVSRSKILMVFTILTITDLFCGLQEIKRFVLFTLFDHTLGIYSQYTYILFLSITPPASLPPLLSVLP